MNVDVIRAWKDAEYRESLSDEELAAVPQHPVGTVELNEEDLSGVMGGNGGGSQTCCQNLSVCINTVLVCSIACF